MPRINKLEAEKARSSWNLQTRKVERVLSLATHLSLSFCLMRSLFSTSGQLCNARWRCGAKGQRGRENKKNEKWHLSQAWFPRLLSEKSVTSDTRTRRHHWVIVPNIPVSIRLKAKLPEGMALACCPQPFLSALLVTCRVLIIASLSSAINHQALSLPKAKKHLIMCLWLCQRGSAQFWFCSGPTDSCRGVCGDGRVGGQSWAVLYHTTGKRVLAL